MAETIGYGQHNHDQVFFWTLQRHALVLCFGGSGLQMKLVPLIETNVMTTLRIQFVVDGERSFRVVSNNSIC